MSSKTKKITLVLGAGSSTSVGYPVGAGLRTKIFQLATQERQPFAIQAGLYTNDAQLHQFVSAFRKSQMLSVDAFLARRSEYAEIGKMAIATLLLEIEDEQHLLDVDHKNHWYRYFYNKFASESWSSLDFSDITIVTFNYDRSLEKYLHVSIKESYGKTDLEAAEKLETLKVIHVYGSLGSPIAGKADYLAYGGEISEDKVKIAANTIKVIPEGRDDDETLECARKMLANADCIAFMGFGFDETNVARLRPLETCQKKIRQEGAFYKNRKIIATCKGFTPAESMKAFRLIGQDTEGFHPDYSHPPGFHADDCLTMLRETLFLD